MKISHRELEDCLRDPSGWVATKLSPSSGGPRGGYDFCLREGIYRFHKTEDPAEARRYIEQTTSRRKLTNRLRLESVLERFDAYVYWFLNSGLIVADHRSRLDFDLGSGVSLGGQISRLDMMPDGYRAVLLGKIPPGWRQELRMPLIQRGAARKYSRPEDEVSVGLQELDASNLETVSFSPTELDEAEETARQLAAGVDSEIKKYES